MYEGEKIKMVSDLQALALGAIPIVEENPLSEQLFKDHPVIILPSLFNITSEMLNKFVKELKNNRKLHRNHLWFEYWRHWIYQKKKSVHIKD